MGAGQIENDIRGLLRNFGLKVGLVGKTQFEARIRQLVVDEPELQPVMDSLLSARAGLRASEAALHCRLLQLVRQDPVCRRLMSVPGVGPVVSLAFVATIDDPSRFSNSKAVGPALGLVPGSTSPGKRSGSGVSRDAATR